MNVYILVDENKIVRCMASEEANLHDDKLHMKKHFVERQGTVGDEYDELTDTWTLRPENYPQPSQERLDDRKIESEMRAIQREKAIQSLIDKGELPPGYEDKQGG